MLLGDVTHQKPGVPGRAEHTRGEAARGHARDETALAQRAQTDSGADDLLTQALARENLARAWKRVKANKGSAGVDGRTVHATAQWLKTAWPNIRRQLLDGSYRPSPVRAVGIPKPGGGTRQLGIPTVVDRLIQQALLQVLQPRLDPHFSAHSYGFRPGRSAHGAVLQAQQYVAEGYRVVVDVDLEKFFDRVNHDILMDRLAKRIADTRVLRLIRRYLAAGVMADGLVSPRSEGTPQGGPLSPLLANVLLDEVDRKLERRGHRFVRYADDCNVYVKSQRAGERVLQWLRRCYAQLALRVNESKTAVGLAWGRKFLGYRLFRNKRGDVKLGISAHAMTQLKHRLRRLTRSTCGRSLEHIAQDLQAYVPGWKAYFRLGTEQELRALDSGLRYRLRVVRLRHWRHGPKIYRELRALGASEALAARIASNSRGWWRTAREGANRVLTNAYFAALGVPQFS